MKQIIITPKNDYEGLDNWINVHKCKKIFLVCGTSFQYQNELHAYFDEIERKGFKIVKFKEFQPNPLYENVQDGVKLFREKRCDSIISIGGGSAIDVAKCIKAFYEMPGNGENGNWLNQTIENNNIPFLVMPTTAGTGSETTRYAVIYYNGEKQSITSKSFIPETVLMDPNCLITLPIYQKKSSMCDALCHAIESFWSVNSTEESIQYSTEAIKLILANLDNYLNNKEDARKNMLLAANIAGKAINITQTTAGHAMCYKITTLFGVTHGHATILCNRVLFPWMLDNIDKCIDPRGEEYLRDVFLRIAYALGCSTAKQGAQKLNYIFEKLEFEIPKATKEEYEELKKHVNPERLKNHPIELNVEMIDYLYHEILR